MAVIFLSFCDGSYFSCGTGLWAEYKWDHFFNITLRTMDFKFATIIDQYILLFPFYNWKTIPKISTTLKLKSDMFTIYYCCLDIFSCYLCIERLTAKSFSSLNRSLGCFFTHCVTGKKQDFPISLSVKNCNNYRNIIAFPVKICFFAVYAYERFFPLLVE